MLQWKGHKCVKWEGRREVTVMVMGIPRHDLWVVDDQERIYEWATEMLTSQSEITRSSESGLGKSKALDSRKTGGEGAFLITNLHFAKRLTTLSRSHGLWCDSARLEIHIHSSPLDNSHIPDRPGYKITGAIAVNMSRIVVVGFPSSLSWFYW